MAATAATAAAALILLLFLSSFPSISVLAVAEEVVLEDGYEVSTVLDGNKLPSPIRPFSLLPRRTGGKNSLQIMLLDSANSAFYALPLPISLSPDAEVSRFAGKGVSGYADGEAEVAMFNHPRSFATDSKGNIYVADRSNHVIRKISTSGMTTTIAGGYTKKAGNTDGPAQNASFSDDFELAYIPNMCALLISDRGNSLIRRLNLQKEDCTQESQHGLGTASVSSIAVLCVLIGFIIGFIARPFLCIPHVSYRQGIYRDLKFNKTWKHCQTNVETMTLTLYCGIRSVAANLLDVHSILYKLVSSIFSHCFSIHRIPCLEEQAQHQNHVSLLDSAATELSKPVYTDQLRDLISFDEDLSNSVSCSGQGSEQKCPSADNMGFVDLMINANLSDFGVHSKQELIDRSVVINQGLSMRKNGAVISASM